MKLQSFILICLFIATTAYSQQPGGTIYYETNIVPLETGAKCYISWRIPNDWLVFVKSESSFKAGFEFSIEVEKEKEIINRETDSREVIASDYEGTENPAVYSEGVINFDLPYGKFILKPFLNISNSSASVTLDEFEIEITPGITLTPFIVKKQNGGDKIFRMVNADNSLPFSNGEYQLVLSLRNYEGNEISATVIQEKRTLFEKKLKKHVSGVPVLKSEENHVFLDIEDRDKNFAIFILDSFSRKLEEGDFVLYLNGESYEDTIKLKTEWIDKPFTLTDLDFAAKLMKGTFGSEATENIFSADDAYLAIKEFWKPKDPVDETVFNEIMNEFFNRADEAYLRFRSVNNKNGANTDRGMIFIKYGPPKKIKRSYNDKNHAVEIWQYGKKRFVFVDKSGLGNFALM